GAYSDAGPRVTQKAAYRVHGPYRIPNIKSDACAVYTNTVPAGSFRGMGTPQVVWAYESQMDMIAHEMGWDAVEFRLKNLMEKGDELAPGDTPVDCDMKQGLRRVAEEIGWGQKVDPDCGIGISCALKDGGAAIIKFPRHGSRSTRKAKSFCSKALSRSARARTRRSVRLPRKNSVSLPKVSSWRRSTQPTRPSILAPTPAAVRP